jgi:hypothetical protein
MGFFVNNSAIDVEFLVDSRYFAQPFFSLSTIAVYMGKMVMY